MTAINICLFLYGAITMWGLLTAIENKDWKNATWFGIALSVGMALSVMLDLRG